MIYISDAQLDSWLEEDVPYLDLTTEMLGITTQWGKMTYRTRHQTVIACAEEAGRILERGGAQVSDIVKSGTILEAGQTMLSATGEAGVLHRGWRVAQNILEFTGGIATQTRRLVDLATRVNPKIRLLTTRKTPPGTKKLAMKAVLSGGAWPHRLGLSETLLVFDSHIVFMEGGWDTFYQSLFGMSAHFLEKTLVVEAKDLDTGMQLAQAGVPVVQLDKLTPTILENMVKKIREKGLSTRLLAAGGINENNIQDYAQTGVEGLVLTSPYYAKLADIEVVFEKMTMVTGALSSRL